MCDPIGSSFRFGVCHVERCIARLSSLEVYCGEESLPIHEVLTFMRYCRAEASPGEARIYDYRGRVREEPRPIIVVDRLSYVCSIAFGRGCESHRHSVLFARVPIRFSRCSETWDFFFQVCLPCFLERGTLRFGRGTYVEASRIHSIQRIIPHIPIKIPSIPSRIRREEPLKVLGVVAA